MLPPAFEMALFRRLMTSGRVLPAGQRVHVWFSTKKSEGHCLVSHWVSGLEGSAPAAECIPGAHATQLWLSTRSSVPHALGSTHAPHPLERCCAIYEACYGEEHEMTAKARSMLTAVCEAAIQARA
jgi:hypothetical protein